MDGQYNQHNRTLKMKPSQKNVYDYFESKGFFFPKEILTRYYLSLKTKPFVILTGISGTGKTKIAQIFADYICQDDKGKDNRVAFVSVRPDWMDNKGLLGFYNILDEKYHSTKVLDTIIEARANPEKAYFVILDEMNLAKVEHYFSDFLSVLESRTPDNPAGEPVSLHSIKNVKTHAGDDIDGEVSIPPNLFFTGTVNVDESTYMFSPKVLDRANVIEFNEVNLDGYAGKSSALSDSSLVLENEDVREALNNREETPFCSSKDYMKFKEVEETKEGHSIIQNLLTLLQVHNMHFGYRVINEICRFINICSQEVQEFDLNAAMDVQIIQKILPKFHGTRAKLEEPLKELVSFCYGNQRPITEDQLALASMFDKEALFPRSAQKIAKMLRQLSVQGYVSFIE